MTNKKIYFDNSTILVGLFFLIFILSFGLFNSKLASYHISWLLIILLIGFGLNQFYKSFDKNTGEPVRKSGVEWLAFGLASTILFLSVIHWLSLAIIPGYQSVNLQGLAAAGWISENFKFSIYYLYFPVFLVLAINLFKHSSFKISIRVFCIFLLISLLVQFYQRYIDGNFINSWSGGNRFGGLSTDPNSFAMVIFLSMPLLAYLIWYDKNKFWQFYAVFIFFFSFAGLLLTGNRTMAVAAFVFIGFVPTVYAFLKKDLNFVVRALLILFPWLLLFVFITLLEFYPDVVKSSSLLGERILSTYQKFSDGGFTAIFFKDEARGALWLVGMGLLQRSFISGWGPGGFYREYSNENYLLTQNISPAFDSVLNHYLMIQIDFGIFVALVYVFLMFMPLAFGFVGLKRKLFGENTFFVAIIFLSQIIFYLSINTNHIAYFPDVIWIWVVNLAILFVLSDRVGLVDGFSRWLNPYRRLFTITLLVGWMVTIVISYFVTFGSEGYSNRLSSYEPFKYQRNCLPVEADGSDSWQWCGSNARLKVPLAQLQEGEELSFTLAAHNPDLSSRPLEVRYGGLDGPKHAIQLTAAQSVQVINIPLDDDYIVVEADASGKTVRFAVLSIDVSHTWVPKAMRVNADTRELGVRVKLPDLASSLLQNCYAVETNGTDRWRWCGKNAKLALPLKDSEARSLVFNLAAQNPDLSDKPLVVRYGGHAGVLKSVTLNSVQSYLPVSIPLDADHVIELLGSEETHARFVVLSIDVSHTWSPKAMGLSEDTRDLGVSVQLPPDR